jgi:flavodoxin
LKALIVFYSNSGRTKSIAEEIARGLAEKSVENQLLPLDKAKKSKANQKNRERKENGFDIGEFDLLVVGSKRKISRELESFIKECKGLDGKKSVVFLTCFGVAGTSLKKITGMLNARGSTVIDSLVITYLLGISAKQLESAREFGKKITGEKDIST